MLRAVMMALQRQPSLWLHHNAFYLVPVATVEALVPTPGSMDAIMVYGEIVAIALEIVDDQFNPFGIRLRGY
jgi:hypothetical protein